MKLLIRLCLPLFFIACIPTLIGFCSNSSESRTTLSDSMYKNISVSDGNIYIGNYTNYDVEEYTERGKFIRTYDCNTLGDFSFLTKDNGILIIRNVRENEVITYSKNGQLISVENNSDDNINNIASSQCIDNHGNHYELINNVISEKVIRISPNGSISEILALSTNIIIFRIVKIILFLCMAIACIIISIILFSKYMKNKIETELK